MAFTALLLVPLLGLRSLHLSVPLSYRGDGLAVGVHVKNVLEHGWIDSDRFLGAPWGQHANDFPGADNLHLAVIRVLGLGSDQYGVVLNAYFLLSFPLAAGAALWAFRYFGISRVLSAVLAVLFALAPYHFTRAEGHLFLAAYYPVPFAVVLLHKVALGRPLWTRRRWSLTNVGTFLALVLLGSASSYYGIFTLLLATLAGGLRLLQERNLRRLGGVVAMQAMLLGVLVANMLPNLLYQRSHGPNLVALVRNQGATEIYSFKLTSLLLPWPQHRIGALADLRDHYDTTFPLRSEYPALGLVAAVGLLLLLGTLVLSATRGRRESPLADLSGLTLLTFLLGTVGGLATLFALTISDNLRGWNRLSIFLSVLCLAAVGRAVDARLDVTSSALRAAVAVALLAVGVYDQTPAQQPAQRQELLASWNSDEAFTRQIQQTVPRDGIVFQLPYLFYPEAHTLVELHDSDPFRFYLHSTTVRWTYGSIRGRAKADWSAAVAAQPVDQMLGLLAAANIAGVQVSRQGYADRGAALETQLSTVLGQQPVVSRDEKFSFFDLAAHNAVVRARHPAAEIDTVGQHVVLHPVAYPYRFPGTTPELRIDNGSGSTQRATLDVQLLAADRRDAVTVRWPDGSTQTLQSPDGLLRLSRDLELAPGTTTISFRAAHRLEVRGLVVTDPVLAAFVP